MPYRSLPILLLLAVLAACSSSRVETSDAGSSGAGVASEAVLSGLNDPWGMDFLPDGSLLVTEKSGALLWVDLAAPTRRTVSGVPASADVGQGGLLDVMVYPAADAVWIYLSYAVEADNGHTTRVARARWREGALEDIQVLFTAWPSYKGGRHFGSRLLMHEGYLYFSVGDRGNRRYAQDLSRHNGKVMRLLPDGRVPSDNPFVDRDNAQPEIWTYGHRNPQGMALNPVDGTIWVAEHGPRGGDELNRLAPGNNYGWPVITYGEEYAGGEIGIGTHKEGMEQPLKYYVPSIATCGMTFYQGDTYPGWGDSVLVAALAGTHINRVALDGAGPGMESRLLQDSKLRFRDVQQGPDGFVYVLAGGDRLLRLVPGR